jgi:hypothetical protein
MRVLPSEFVTTSPPFRNFLSLSDVICKDDSPVYGWSTQTEKFRHALQYFKLYSTVKQIQVSVAD